MAERVTPRTLDLEVRGSSSARHFVSLGKGLYSTLSLFTQVYKWVPASYCWGGGGGCDGLASRPGGNSNTPRHASCYGNRVKLRPCAPLPFLCNSLINWLRRTRFIRTPKRHATVSVLLKQALRMKR